VGDWTDHLHEARKHVQVSPQSREDHLMRAQAHALIAIAEELREWNAREWEKRQ